MAEQIKHAAVKNIHGLAVLGKCHADCFHKGDELGWRMSSAADDQGFVTSEGQYVGRKEAARIALIAGQITKPTTILFSEDLWSPTDGGVHSYDPIKGYFKEPGNE